MFFSHRQTKLACCLIWREHFVKHPSSLAILDAKAEMAAIASEIVRLTVSFWSQQVDLVFSIQVATSTSNCQRVHCALALVRYLHALCRVLSDDFHTVGIIGFG